MVFLHLSLSASRLRIWGGGRSNGSGVGAERTKKRVRRRKKTKQKKKRWTMWLRVMSKKLHKAFSQITYQLHAWHYPWSISSVLDQVPVARRRKYVRTHTHTTVPLSPPSLSLSDWIYIVLGGESNSRNKTCQVSYQYGDLLSLAAVPPLLQTQPDLPVISKPLFGEASLSEQWENIQCISIGGLWFLFVLHLLCLCMLHGNDSRVRCINLHAIWFSEGLCGGI